MSVRQLVVYHADCLDGFGAAYVAWRALGDGTVFRPMHHGEKLARDALRGARVLILDFSFAPDTLLAMAEVAAELTQLDHHATARADWGERFDASNAAWQTWRHPQLPLTVSFDLGKSGVRLAWEHFFPNDPLPLPLAHVEDQDLWRFALPETRAFNRALRLMPYSFAEWDRVVREAAERESPRYRAMLREGEAIERFYRGEIERLANGPLVIPVDLPGAAVGREHAARQGVPVIEHDGACCRVLTGLAVNANGVFSSELGNRLAERSGSFGLIWYLHSDGEVKCSLRSTGAVDVGVLAQKFGGGGHRNAAGFRLPLARFMREILRRV